MRKIKYRGLYMGNWWFASVDPEEGPCDCWEQFWYIVDRKTVGQYTGLKDKNGVEIYEGDIVKTYEHIDIVIWREDLCGFSLKNDTSRMNLVDWLENGQYSEPQVIGNVYQNPELLNEKL